MLTVSLTSTQLAGISRNGTCALNHRSTRLNHRAARKCVTPAATMYWEDLSAVARAKDSVPQVSANSLMRHSQYSAHELWHQAETARRTAKRICSFAAFSANGAAFSQLTMNASCAAEWRKVEELEDAASVAEAVEQAIERESGSSSPGALSPR